jgi:predicted transposase YbfD/YdcC
VVDKTASRKSSAKAPEQTLSYYLSSRVPGRAEAFAGLIRGHWGGCEIRNHWVRDALWGEDKTRSKNWNLNANLAIVRSSLIALRSRLASHLSWPSLFELCSLKPSLAYNLVARHTFK